MGVWIVTEPGMKTLLVTLATDLEPWVSTPGVLQLRYYGRRGCPSSKDALGLSKDVGQGGDRQEVSRRAGPNFSSNRTQVLVRNFSLFT